MKRLALVSFAVVVVAGCSYETSTNTVGANDAQSGSTSVSPAISPSTAALILATAQLGTVPTSADYTARGWIDLEELFPSRSWSDQQQDPDYGYARGGEVAEGVTVSAKGTNRAILQTVILYEYLYPSFNVPEAEGPRLSLLSEFESALTPTDRRCDTNESVSFRERWYRVSPQGMKPVTAKYESSGGNASGYESLTFDSSELPPVGTEALEGTWTGECSD